MTKAAHDVGCASRRSERCDCKTGRDRHIQRAAKESLKRRTSEIIEVPRGTLGQEDWLKLKLTGGTR